MAWECSVNNTDLRRQSVHEHMNSVSPVRVLTGPRDAVRGLAELQEREHEA
ncbi:hypothetical protein FHX35_001758 [Auritidibacter ignavus]|nr:hypothetical protein [Auritidibacter ignavus]